MRRGGATVLAMIWAVWAAPVLAHPHVFIDAGVDVIFGPDGRAEALHEAAGFARLQCRHRRAVRDEDRGDRACSHAAIGTGAGAWRSEPR